MKFKVLHNLLHDNKKYKAGDFVEMAELEAVSLVEDGILEEFIERTYQDMPTVELRKIANEKGIDVKGVRKKEDIITLLEGGSLDKDDDDDNESKKVLMGILEKDPDELTEEEITILKGAELSEDFKEKFANVLLEE